VHSHEAIYVDNSFAAPGANGCVLKLFGFIPISINAFITANPYVPKIDPASHPTNNHTASTSTQPFTHRHTIRTTPYPPSETDP